MDKYIRKRAPDAGDSTTPSPTSSPSSSSDEMPTTSTMTASISKLRSSTPSTSTAGPSTPQRSMEYKRTPSRKETPSKVDEGEKKEVEYITLGDESEEAESDNVEQQMAEESAEAPAREGEAEDNAESMEGVDGDVEEDGMEVNKKKQKRRRDLNLGIDMLVRGPLEDVEDTEEGRKLTRSARRSAQQIGDGSFNESCRSERSDTSPAKKKRVVLDDDDSDREEEEAPRSGKGGSRGRRRGTAHDGESGDEHMEMGDDEQDEAQLDVSDLSLDEKRDGAGKKRKSRKTYGNDLSIDMNVDLLDDVNDEGGSERRRTRNAARARAAEVVLPSEDRATDDVAGSSTEKTRTPLPSTPSWKMHVTPGTPRTPRTGGTYDRARAAKIAGEEKAEEQEPKPHHGRGDMIRWTCGGKNCQRAFATHPQVYEHMLYDHPDTDIVGKCLDCGLFADFPDLIEHRKKGDKATCGARHATMVYWTYDEIESKDMSEMEKRAREAYSALASLLRSCLFENCPRGHPKMEEFDTFKELEKHNAKAHRVQLCYVCRGCGREYRSAVKYLKHARDHQSTEAPRIKGIMLDEKEEEDEEEEEKKKEEGTEEEGTTNEERSEEASTE